MTENTVFGFELIDFDIIAKWQGIADLLAKIIAVPAALIMKTENEYMEVLVSSNTDNNPYRGGDKEQWHGLLLRFVTIDTLRFNSLGTVMRDANVQ